MFMTVPGGGFCGDSDTTGKDEFIQTVSGILIHCLILLARN